MEAVMAVAWNGWNFAEIGKLWAKARATHAIGLAGGQLFIRQSDTRPFDSTSIVWVPMDALIDVDEDRLVWSRP
jgi:hypothetical protein